MFLLRIFQIELSIFQSSKTTWLWKAKHTLSRRLETETWLDQVVSGTTQQLNSQVFSKLLGFVFQQLPRTSCLKGMVPSGWCCLWAGGGNLRTLDGWGRHSLCLEGRLGTTPFLSACTLWGGQLWSTTGHILMLSASSQDQSWRVKWLKIPKGQDSSYPLMS